MSPYITYPILIIAQKYPTLLLALLMYKLYTMAKNEKRPLTKALLCTKLIALTRKRYL